ncbi:fluoride efflux transporter FluC [Lactiplantibacillus modestisalitolerans]|uniref:Fluoride-specific ion channel n=1 Tax=Lactiplantibacillus modestisalitolerans TaxID=1457219 RepID=A0ABV5WQU2_9LACO|nr:CrcB family protein [Lactiplantibacillus modestisalitolerans]
MTGEFTSTLIVNLVGAFLLSFITTGLPAKLPVSPTLMTGLSTGLIGSFTTFSTFSVETLQLIQSGHSVLASGYLALSLGGASVAAWLAISCNNRWLQHPKGGAD